MLHIAIELFRDSRPKDAVPPTTQTAPVVKSTNWFASLFSSASTPGTPPPGIGRTPTESLTTAERAKLDGYYVRLRYNDEPVTVPGCRAQGNHLPGDESFCTLAAFKSVVDKFTPKDWKQECRLNAKAIVFPEKVEPAGFLSVHMRCKVEGRLPRDVNVVLAIQDISFARHDNQEINKLRRRVSRFVDFYSGTWPIHALEFHAPHGIDFPPDALTHDLRVPLAEFGPAIQHDTSKTKKKNLD
ncbi:hypothetical protein HYQ46_009676 [Verticillium longisporum]|nr:hypothetical protein HYQ46_009676 [Verticillium longisporum]